MPTLLSNPALQPSRNLADLILPGDARFNLGLDGNRRPQEHGLISWAYDPIAAVNSSAPTLGTQYVVKCTTGKQSGVITSIWIMVVTGGTTLTASQCLAGVYQGLNLLGTTADQSTNWATPGLYKMDISGGPVSYTSNDIYVSFYANGGAAPAFARGTGQSVGNVNVSSTASRFGTASSGRTTSLINPIVSVSTSTLTFWVAVS